MNKKQHPLTPDMCNTKAMSPQPTVFDIPLAEFGEKILKAKSREDAHKLAMEITNDFFKCRDKIAYRAEERGKAVGKDELRAEFRDMLGIAKKQTVDIG